MQKITGQAITSKKASTKIVNAFLKVKIYKYIINIEHLFLKKLTKKYFQEKCIKKSSLKHTININLLKIKCKFI